MEYLLLEYWPKNTRPTFAMVDDIELLGLDLQLAEQTAMDRWRTDTAAT